MHASILYLGKPLKEGQVILCLVLPGANSRSVPVTINPDQIYTALVGVFLRALMLSFKISGECLGHNILLCHVIINGPL